MESQRQGKIVTFYSYKGGTGRTMALANVAWVLASFGHRVLAVDWDLEGAGAPSLLPPLSDRQALPRYAGGHGSGLGLRNRGHDPGAGGASKRTPSGT